MNDAGDIVSTLPIVSSEFAAVGTNPTYANYAKGDVVVSSINTATTTPTLGVVTAVTSTTLTIATDNAAAANFVQTGNWSISKVFSARGQGRTMVAEDVKALVAVAAEAPTTNISPTSDQTVSIISITANGGRDITINSIKFNATGSFNAPNAGTISGFQLWRDNTTLLASGTNTNAVANTICTNGVVGYDSVDSDGAGADIIADCPDDSITFTPAGGLVVNQGQTVKLFVRANLSNARAAATTNDPAVALQLAGTSAGRDVNNTLSYTYANGKPQSVSITTNYNDVYPLTTSNRTIK